MLQAITLRTEKHMHLISYASIFFNFFKGDIISKSYLVSKPKFLQNLFFFSYFEKRFSTSSKPPRPNCFRPPVRESRLPFSRAKNLGAASATSSLFRLDSLSSLVRSSKLLPRRRPFLSRSPVRV
ncbi:hypothetical protein KSP39_PZI024287 [Platanthera zijinensis]|uniref:Uncharacterized protein n=1 Tax=Platanthera zijinensis TaxID=2320716 RepID=A0AAP0ATW4_9ASPA